MLAPKKRPTTPYKNIEPILSAGVWKWRARIRVDGKSICGTLRFDATEAHKDIMLLRARTGAWLDRRPQTLVEAFTLLIDDARMRGLEETTIQGNYGAPSRAIVRDFFPAETALANIDQAAVQGMIRTALAIGRKPYTIKKNYLRVLREAFEMAGLESPTQAAAKAMKAALKSKTLQMPWMTQDEVAQLLVDMRDWVNPNGKPLKVQARDVALVTLFAYTGVRREELARCSVGDIDLERGLLHVRKAKSKSKPRSTPIPPVACEACAYLVEGRKADAPLVTERILNHMFTQWKHRLPQWKEQFRGGRSLRRSYGTGLAMTRAPFHVIQELMGHARGSQETFRYLEAADQHLREAANQLGPPSSDSQE